MYSLLLVEDDRHLRDGLEQLLGAEGYLCRACGSVEEAEAVLSAPVRGDDETVFMPDLCVLDRQLPGASGDELCKRLRQHHPVLPILMLSGLDTAQDKVAGLRAGADDYLAKPFLVDELIARLAAMRRRIPWLQAPQTDGRLELGDRYIDSQGMLIHFADGRQTRLNVRELRLLECLHRRRGKVVSRDELYDVGWGRQHLPNSRALDQYMVGLRQKLEDQDARHRLIESVRGVGYRLVS